jgi:integrase
VQLDLPYLSKERDRRGNLRLYARRHGKRIRLKEQPGSPDFLKSYAAAVEALNDAAGAVIPVKGKTTPGTLGWLTARYMASNVFAKFDSISQRTRQGVLEHCLREPIKPGSKEIMAGCPLTVLSAKRVAMLRDRKKGLPGAANNRLKYLTSMFRWAVEIGHLKTNPAREVHWEKYATDGFYSWSIEEVRQFETCYPIGSKPRLAMALLLYLGVRRGDVVRIGDKHVTNGWIKFVPAKTNYMRVTPSEKPILPELARIIAATPTGIDTFLVTEFGKPFTENGFGGWFRERCDKAGLPQCTAHGLRKVGATICAEAGASERQMMALFDWTTPGQASKYVAKASTKRMAGEASRLIDQRMNVTRGSDGEH